MSSGRDLNARPEAAELRYGEKIFHQKNTFGRVGIEQISSELRWVSERKGGRRRSEPCGKDFLVKKYFCKKLCVIQDI